MKSRNLAFFLILLSSFCFGQATEDKVKIYISESDTYELLNMSELIGEWRNSSFNTPLALIEVEDEFPQTNGQVAFGINGRVAIKDQTLESSYPNRLKNVLWRVEGTRLYLISSDLGKREVEVEWDSMKKEFQFTIDYIRYSKFGGYANFYK